PSCRNTTTGWDEAGTPTQAYSRRSSAPRQSMRANCGALVAMRIAASVRRAAQAEALDLAGRGLRQVVDEHDLARVFVRRQRGLDEGLEFIRQLRRGAVAARQHHIGRG